MKLIKKILCKLFGWFCPEPPVPPVEYVYLDTCLDSLEMRNTFCPDDRILWQVKYIKGIEPTTWCGFHKKPEPPTPPIPPIPEPCKPYIGASFYQLLTESKEDIRWFISQLKAHGGNATEVFLTFTWSNGWKHSPFKQVGTWSEEKFGDYKFPMFDLFQWNEDYWDKLLFLMLECKDNGIALFMRIQDYCSVKDGFEKRHYPFSNGSNIQEYTGGMWGVPIRYWYARLNEKLIATINEAELEHYFLIPMNEADVVGNDWPGGEDEKDSVCEQFHEFYINDLISLGVDEDRIILSIDRPNVYDFFDDLYRMEIHGIASPESLDDVSTSHFPNGDGAKDGNGLSSHGYTEPSYDQGVEMGKVLKNKFGYCYFLRTTEETEQASVRKANFIALDGLVEGVNA